MIQGLGTQHIGIAVSGLLVNILHTVDTAGAFDVVNRNLNAQLLGQQVSPWDGW